MTTKLLACTTADTAFVAWGVASDRALGSATYFRLLETGDGEFEPSAAFFDRLGAAFGDAFTRRADASLLPPAVEAAIADARPATAHEFLDRPEADLHEEVLPAFVERVGTFSCIYVGE